MTDETKTDTTEEISEVKKSEQVSDPSALSIIASLVRKQDERIDSFEKRFDSIETLIKEQNANPVDSGIEAENKPKTEDEKDVGDKVTIGNAVAPVPSDAQASIIAPALETNTSDKEGLKMENKADEDKKEDEKVEEKKEEVAKTDEDEKEEKKEEKAEDIKKSDDKTYEIVKTVRPKVYREEPRSSLPTGYQVLKAAANGWNGETQSAEEALTIMYRKEAAGEFGNGQPTFEGVY